MIAIEVKYVGPTDHKPSRLVASTCNGHRLVMSYNTASDESGDTGSGEKAARHVAQALATKEGLGTLRDSGGTKAGWAFCFPDKVQA